MSKGYYCIVFYVQLLEFISLIDKIKKTYLDKCMISAQAKPNLITPDSHVKSRQNIYENLCTVKICRKFAMLSM